MRPRRIPGARALALLAALALPCTPAASEAACATGPAAERRAPSTASAPEPRAHPGPPVFLEFALEGDALSLSLTGEQRVLCAWLGVDAPLVLPLDPDLRVDLLQRATRVLPELGSVELDGTAVAAEALDAAAYDASLRLFGDEPVLELRLRFRDPGGSPPQTVHVRWSRYPEDTRGGLPKVPLHFRSEEAFEYLVLLEDEPEFTWHRPSEHGLALAAGLLTDSGGRPGARTAALALLAALLTGVAATRRPGVGRGAAWTLALGCAIGVPLLPKGAAVPPEAEALDLWETLHRRVYGAFDATTEEQVYTLLEASVVRSLIDPLYTGIHESLVLREEGGGAVARVEDVVVLERSFEPRGSLHGRPAFDVDATWRVDGGVVHFGHEHRRRTRYRARCTVVHDGQAWRLAGLDVREQVREPLGD